jgi:hypothetical protein
MPREVSLEEFGAEVKPGKPKALDAAPFFRMTPKERAKHFYAKYGSHVREAISLLVPPELAHKIEPVDRIHAIPLYFDVEKGTCESPISHDMLDNAYSRLILSRVGDLSFSKKLAALAPRAQRRLDPETNCYKGFVGELDKNGFYRKLESELEPILRELRAAKPAGEVLDHMLLFESEKAKHGDYAASTGGGSSVNSIFVLSSTVFKPKRLSPEFDVNSLAHEIGHNTLFKTLPGLREERVHELFAHAFGLCALRAHYLEINPKGEKEFNDWAGGFLAVAPHEGSADPHDWACQTLGNILMRNAWDFKSAMREVRDTVYGG